MPETGNGNYSLIFMTENNIKKETLSIRISTNGFCFCSYTPEVPDSLKVFNYTPEEDCSLASNIRTAIERCLLIKEKGIYDIKAIIETGEYTCIPTEHDIPSEYKQYFHYQQKEYYFFLKILVIFRLRRNHRALQGRQQKFCCRFLLAVHFYPT